MTRDGRPSRVAILVVNGFDRRSRYGRYSQAEAVEFPWIEVCLRQVERHSRDWDYEVLVYDNSYLASHRRVMNSYPRVRVLPSAPVAVAGRLATEAVTRLVAPLPAWMANANRFFERRHPVALDHLVAQTSDEVEYIVTLDTDSFPVSDGWLDALVGACERGASLAGVYRDEMAPQLAPFVHVSGLCIRRVDLCALDVSFARGVGQDIGQNITDAIEARGLPIAPLRRSNEVNFHFILGGIYGDVIYHHGAGSRRGMFWTSTDLDRDDRMRETLRDLVFEDVDHLTDVLRGRAANDTGLEPWHGAGSSA